jgi:hemolysin activation/secretion protein
MGYTTSPERLDDVKIYSMGYRIPLYRMGDSIDLMCGYSDVTGSQTLLAGTTSMSMNFVGKGKLCGAKYNYLLGRDGEVTSRVIFGVDYKDFDRVVANINGAQIPSPGYQLYPLSVTYLRQLQRPGLGVDTNVSLIQNIGSDANTIQGVLNSSEDAVSNPTMRARTTNPDYRIVKAGVSLLTLLNDNAWQWRNSLNLQRASDPLVGAEQMGMGGSMTVRGLPEREFGTDDGIIFTSEVTLTDLKKTFTLEGNLFPVVFVDHAQGSNQGFNSNTTTQTEHVSATSAGLGLRYALDKDLFLKVDLGRVLALDAKTYTGTQAQGTLDGEVGKEYKSFYEGTWRAHASFMARF